MQFFMEALVPMQIEKPKVPPKLYDSDMIISLGAFDDNWLMRADTLILGMRFDAVLDVQKLKTGLETLLNMDGYRKLGSRVRINMAGLCEYHIPASFSVQRPAFNYSHLDLTAQSVNEHKLGRRIPTVQAVPTLQSSCKELLPIIVGADAPRYFQDWASRDCALLALHITSFSDTTIVSLTWPHCAMDFMGVTAVVKAWTAVMSGQMDKVPLVVGFDKDLAALYGAEKPAVKSKYSQNEIKGSKLFRFLLSCAYEDNLRGEIKDPMICLPADMVQKLHAHARKELQEANGGKEVWISLNDVMTAVILKLLTGDLSRDSNRPISFFHATGLRSRAKDIFPPGSFYMGCAVLSTYQTFTAAKTIKQASIADLSLTVRKVLAEQTSDQELKAFAYEYRQQMSTRPERFSLCGYPWARLVIGSSFLQGGLFEFDFSSALADETTHTGPLHPSNVLTPKWAKIPAANGYRIHGKDQQGNVWLRLYISTKAAKGVGRELDAIYKYSQTL